MTNEERLNETIQILEDLIQAIKDRDLNRFDDLTYDRKEVYRSGQGLAVTADLERTRFIISRGKIVEQAEQAVLAKLAQQGHKDLGE